MWLELDSKNFEEINLRTKSKPFRTAYRIQVDITQYMYITEMSVYHKKICTRLLKWSNVCVLESLFHCSSQSFERPNTKPDQSIIKIMVIQLGSLLKITSNWKKKKTKQKQDNIVIHNYEKLIVLVMKYKYCFEKQIY